MKDVILSHLQCYPLMTSQDIIKLIYQSEFAGEHLIIDQNQSYQCLKQECQNIKATTYHIEAIGNQLVRFYLFNASDIELYTINQLFICSTNQHNANQETLIKTLNQVKQLDLTVVGLDKEIDQYFKQNCPIIGHSHLYKENYNPHYRVMKREFAYYYPIILEINKLILDLSEVTIAIDGMCGSGKSTLANSLKTIYDCHIFHLDDFFLQSFQRTKQRLKIVGENIDHERFKDEVLIPLSKKAMVLYQKFDCSKMQLDFRIKKMCYKHINFIEGTYSMHPDLIGFYHYKIVLKVDPNTQLKRLVKRGGVKKVENYLKIWIPLENNYFNLFNIDKQANFVFDCSANF